MPKMLFNKEAYVDGEVFALAGEVKEVAEASVERWLKRGAVLSEGEEKTLSAKEKKELEKAAKKAEEEAKKLAEEAAKKAEEEAKKLAELEAEKIANANVNVDNKDVENSEIVGL